MDISVVIIELPFPPSSNTAYPTNRSGRGRHLSEKGAEWLSQAEWHIRVATVGKPMPPLPWHITFALWVPDNRVRDAMNYIKLPQDALCKVVGIDDKWTNIRSNTVVVCGVDKHTPRCVISIGAYNDITP